MTTDRRREIAFVASVAAFAAARVFLGAAALPVFTNVDEESHFDLVYKYARGYLPEAGPSTFDADAARLIALHASPEFLAPPGQFPDGIPEPLWTTPAAEREVQVACDVAAYTALPNLEAHSPPTYYVVAAAWYRAGQLCGLRGGWLIYWVRFLNVLTHAALAVVSYYFVRRFYPGEPFLRAAVPLLVAAFPQDVLFAINSDALSPLAFLIALYLMLAWLDRDGSALGLGVGAGLAAAATFLVKFTNAAILALAAAALVRKVISLARHGQVRRQWVEVAAVATAVCVPVVLWFARNAAVLGEATGTADKVARLGWTPKPLAELGNHPILTWDGFIYFGGELTARFWRGETTWRADQVVPPEADYFFIACTVIFLPAAALRWLMGRRKRATPDGVLLAAVAISVLLLVALSMRFDFDGCWYPSRRRPFFVSGRLIVGVLVPFMVLLVRGIEFVTPKWAGRAVAKVAIIAIVAVCLYARAELIGVTWPSAYNWFHL